MLKSVILLIIIVFSYKSFAETQVKELGLEELFVVSKGYDTNDNVELTLLAKLPSACFSPSHHELTLLPSGKYQLNFFMKKKSISSCQNEEKVLLKTPVYYTKTISLGELKAGSYKVVYNVNGQKKFKSFSVSLSHTNTMDDMEYAPVSNAFIPELVYTTSDAQVILSGIISSTCMELFDEDIKVQRLNDVFVIIPKATVIESPDCQKTELPLQKIVSLGELKTPGSFLIHIRSQSGLSVNKVFQVRKKGFDPSGR